MLLKPVPSRLVILKSNRTRAAIAKHPAMKTKLGMLEVGMVVEMAMETTKKTSRQLSLRRKQSLRRASPKRWPWRCP